MTTPKNIDTPSSEGHTALPWRVQTDRDTVQIVDHFDFPVAQVFDGGEGGESQLTQMSKFAKSLANAGLIVRACNEAEARNNGAQSAHAAMQRERDQARAEASHWQQTSAELNAALAELSRKNDALRAELNAAITELGALKPVVLPEQLVTEVAALRKELSQKNKMLSQRDMRLQEMQTELERLSEAEPTAELYATMQRERDQAHKDLNDARTAYGKHTAALLNAWANEFKHGESIPECATRLMKERDFARGQVKATQQVLEVSEQNVREQSAVIIELRAERERARQTLGEQLAQGDKMRGDLEFYRARALELGTQLSALTMPKPNFVTREEFINLATQVNRLADEFNKVARWFNSRHD